MCFLWEMTVLKFYLASLYSSKRSTQASRLPSEESVCRTFVRAWQATPCPHRVIAPSSPLWQTESASYTITPFHSDGHGRNQHEFNPNAPPVSKHCLNVTLTLLCNSMRMGGSLKPTDIYIPRHTFEWKRPVLNKPDEKCDSQKEQVLASSSILEPNLQHTNQCLIDRHWLRNRTNRPPNL